MRALAPSIVLVALALGGCLVETPTVLEDTLGVAVDWECYYGDCEAVPRWTTELPPDCGGDEDWVVGAGAVAILCAARGEGRSVEAFEGTCRPLRCRDELDCPQWEDLRYGCDDGVCTTDAFGLDPLDVRALCLANVPRAVSCEAGDLDPEAAARTALAAEACPALGRCSVPESCRP